MLSLVLTVHPTLTLTCPRDANLATQKAKGLTSRSLPITKVHKTRRPSNTSTWFSGSRGVRQAQKNTRLNYRVAPRLCSLRPGDSRSPLQRRDSGGTHKRVKPTPRHPPQSGTGSQATVINPRTRTAPEERSRSPPGRVSVRRLTSLSESSVNILLAGLHHTPSVGWLVCRGSSLSSLVCTVLTRVLAVFQ